MTQTQDKKPLNFWLEGETALSDLPEISKSLKILLKKHPDLKASQKARGLLPYKQQPGGFHGLVNIILSQQISTAVASHLVMRLAKLMPEVTPRRLLKLDDDRFRAIGVSRSKIVYCRDLAERIVNKSFDPDKLAEMEDEEAMAALTALKGIGPWSAEIYLMFSLGRADIWPAGDIGIQKGLQHIHGLKERPTPKKARKMAEVWAPHRTAAALIVWPAQNADKGD